MSYRPKPRARQLARRPRAGGFRPRRKRPAPGGPVSTPPATDSHDQGLDTLERWKKRLFAAFLLLSLLLGAAALLLLEAGVVYRVGEIEFGAQTETRHELCNCDLLGDGLIMADIVRARFIEPMLLSKPPSCQRAPTPKGLRTGARKKSDQSAEASVRSCKILLWISTPGGQTSNDPFCLEPFALARESLLSRSTVPVVVGRTREVAALIAAFSQSRIKGAGPGEFPPPRTAQLPARGDSKRR